MQEFFRNQNRRLYPNIFLRFQLMPKRKQQIEIRDKLNEKKDAVLQLQGNLSFESENACITYPAEVLSMSGSDSA